VRARAAAHAAIERARQAHERLGNAIDILPEGIVFLDAEGRYILWNRRYAEIYRGSADLFRPGARLEDTLRVGVARGEYPEAIGCEEDWLARRLALLQSPGERHEQQLADGRHIMIEERRTSDGGIIGLRIDITEMKRRESSFRLLFEGNPIPMLVHDLDHQSIVAVNDAAVAHYGWAREKFIGMTLYDIHDPADHAGLPGIAAEFPGGQAGRTWRHRKADGSVIDVAMYSTLLTYDDRPSALIAAIDITERKRAEARLAFMAEHDVLTSLPNRVLLRSHLSKLLGRSRRSGQHLAVLCLNLDNFKTVNDTLGHPVGDQLLQAIAQRLRAALREHDVAARLGGDEFAILQPDIERPEEAGSLAQRLIGVIAEPCLIDGHQVVVGASIGIALAPADGEDADRLLKNADMALDRAKADGGAGFRVFEPGMDARLQARRRLEVDLRAGLAAGVFEVHYQPLVDLRGGTVTGFEALLRWPHAERGMIPPGEFIPVAEETGLIAPLGALVLRRACQDAAAWPADITVAVNLSPLQFRTGNLLALVMETLRATGLKARRLELEITEGLLLDHNEQVLATLHALRALGVRISMDDFGTGYSSLSYLRSFPFDKIKIDRSFIRDMGSSAGAQAIVRAIVSIGASLGITITAEGVETESDLACLRAEGCNQAQGFLFSHARPQAEILRLLARQARARSAA